MAAPSSKTSDPITLVTEAELKRLYPAADYTKYINPETRGTLTTATRNHIVTHGISYLIVNCKSTDAVLKYIETLRTTAPLKLSAKDGRAHGLTPLHVAVHARKPLLAKALLDTGVSIEDTDQYGWTAAHTAALVAQEVFPLFTVLPKRLTQNDASVADIRRLAGFERALPEIGRVLYAEPSKAPEALPIDIIAEKIGLERYSDEILVPPLILAETVASYQMP